MDNSHLVKQIAEMKKEIQELQAVRRTLTNRVQRLENDLSNLNTIMNTRTPFPGASQYGKTLGETHKSLGQTYDSIGEATMTSYPYRHK
jgi:uncharacterized coiled-coil DUF342 family protein